MTLTEQWKKGELPEGHYYVKDGKTIIAEYLDGYFYNNGEPMTSFSGGVDKVLAPVPSYDEWEKLNWYAGNGVEENIKLKTENKWYSEQLNEAVKKIDKLKELLKECKGSIATLLSKRITEVNGIKQKELLTKINQALGEE